MQAVTAHLPLESVQSSDVYRKIDKKLHRKSTKRRLVRYGLLGFNAVLLFAVLAFVFAGQRSSGDSNRTVRAAITTGVSSSAHVVANPLDQISSADIAVNIARMSALPESTAVVNQADSMNTELTITPSSSSIVSKPQIVATVLKSKKDIKTYVAIAGDNVQTIATKFNVTSDSIKWSNSLNTNVVSIGQAISIPPEGVSGVVYVVKAGDTPDSLAAKYKASRDEIIAYNDAEITPLKPGERIIIPNGSITPSAPVIIRAAVSSYAWGSAPIYGFNGYDYGYCTWYAANRISVPANWGNANTWDNRAAASGWTVSTVPRPGAIGQTDAGAEGHVAVVDGISSDGTMIRYSDMNGLAGWGREGHSWTTGPWVGNDGWAPASKFQHYIYQ